MLTNLFIDDRLVECTSIKRALEGACAEILPRGTKPFVYLSLELPGPHVDANVHPTKQMLHEDASCSATSHAQTLLLSSKKESKKDSFMFKERDDVNCGVCAILFSCIAFLI